MKQPKKSNVIDFLKAASKLSAYVQAKHADHLDRVMKHYHDVMDRTKYKRAL